MNKLITAFPAIETYLPPMLELFNTNNFNTTNRKAAFIGQCAHESGKFTRIVENLNYSQAGLRATFPKYFPNDRLAAAYARQPQKIAARVYGGRMSNGPEATGEGWTYRGRGLIQITGKANYTALAKWLGLSLDETVVYLTTPKGAVHSAIWFWVSNDLHHYADKGDMLTLTKRINGGTNGLQDRVDLFAKARQALS